MFISVIIPCYNSASFLKETLDSVFAQTYQNFEVICVDNGSTDSTLEVIENFSSDRRIILLRESKKGANFARNTGIKHASGDVLQFLDSDDTLHPKKFELQVEVLKNGFDIVVSDRIIYNSDYSEELERISYSEIQQAPLETCISKIIITGNPLYRKSALADCGNWREDLSSAQDWELNIRLALAEKKFGYLSGYFLNCRRHSNSLSYNWIQVNLNAIRVLETHQEKLMESKVTERFDVQKKIFYSYFLAACHSKSDVEYLDKLEHWNLKTPASDYLGGINSFLYKIFGLKITVRIRSFFCSKKSKV